MHTSAEQFHSNAAQWTFYVTSHSQHNVKWAVTVTASTYHF